MIFRYKGCLENINYIICSNEYHINNKANASVLMDNKYTYSIIIHPKNILLFPY